MEREYVDGYFYTRKHDFEVMSDSVKRYSNSSIRIFIWITDKNTPQFTFISSNNIERGSIRPTSSMLIDCDDAVQIKHGYKSKWFRPHFKSDKVICDLIKKAYREWSIEEILIGG